MYSMLMASLYWYARRVRDAFGVTLGLLVDAFDWVRDQRFRRRISVSTNSHRVGRENSQGVWEILGSIPESEFGLTPITSHRDQRGWRYAPSVWHLLQRLRDEEISKRRLSEAFERLMWEINFMLKCPPLAITEDGVVRSKYRPEKLWELSQT